MIIFSQECDLVVANEDLKTSLNIDLPGYELFYIQGKSTMHGKY